MSEDIQSETPYRLLKSVLAISESSSMLAYSGPYMQDYVRMQHNYVHIRLIYVNIQHDYVDMRHSHVNMRLELSKNGCHHTSAINYPCNSLHTITIPDGMYEIFVEKKIIFFAN